MEGGREGGRYMRGKREGIRICTAICHENTCTCTS